MFVIAGVTGHVGSSIGADLDSSATVAPFAGLIDDARIYHRAPSTGELAELANLAS
jgi:hypothetical protein